MGQLLLLFILTIILSFGISNFIYNKRIKEAKKKLKDKIFNISKKSIEAFSSYLLLGEDKIENGFDKYFIEPRITCNNQSVSMQDILNCDDNMIFIGKPGVGKSTLLQKLSLEYSRKEGQISILIKLRDFFAGLLTYDQDQLVKYIESKLFVSNNLLGFSVRSGIPNSKMIVLFDGLDEIGNNKAIALKQMIDYLQSTNQEIKTIISSRPVDYLKLYSHYKASCKINDFSFDQATAYLNNFNISNKILESQGDSNGLFSTPLLLSLLIIRDPKRENFPTNKYELLKQIIYEDLPKWNDKKGKDQDNFLFSQSLKSDFFINCAQIIFEKKISLSKNDIIEITNPLFSKYNISLEKIKYFIDEVTVKYRILIKEDNFYKFFHENILEFFIAESINKDKIQETVIKNVNNPEWKEIISLLFYKTDDPSYLFIEIINNVKINGNVKKVLWEPIFEGVRMEFNKPQFWEKLSLVIFEDDFQKHRVTVLRDVILSKLKSTELKSILPIVWEIVNKKSSDVIDSFREAIREIEFDKNILDGFLKDSIIHNVLDNNKIVIIGEDQIPMQAIINVLKDVPYSYNNCEINVEVKKYDYSTTIKKVDTSLLEETNEYDVIIQPHRELGKLVKNGNVVPILHYFQDFNLDNIKPKFYKYWDEFSWYGEVCYGIPFALTTMYLCYRRDAFLDPNFQKSFINQYGYIPDCPQNWNQIDFFINYYSLKENFSRISKSSNFNTISLQGKGYTDKDKSFHPSIYYEWLNIVYSFGGDILKQLHGYEYGPIVINSSETNRATEKYLALYESNGCDLNSIHNSWDDVYNKLKHDELLLGFIWNDAAYDICYNKDSIFKTDINKIGFCSIPDESLNSKSQVDGWSLFIPINAKDYNKSIGFIEWFMSDEIQTKFQLLGGASAFESIYDNHEVKSLPYNSISKKSLANHAIRETIPEMSQIVNEIIKMLDKIIKEKTPIDISLDKLALELHQNILYENSYKTYIKYMNNGIVQKVNEYFKLNYKEIY